MSSILLTSFTKLEIFPSEYLLDDFTNNQCLALISTNAESVFGLGEPFFRSYDLKLNYLTAEITIFTDNKQAASPETDDWSAIGSPISQAMTWYQD